MKKIFLSTTLALCLASHSQAALRRMVEEGGSMAMRAPVRAFGTKSGVAIRYGISGRELEFFKSDRIVGSTKETRAFNRASESAGHLGRFSLREIDPQKMESALDLHRSQGGIGTHVYYTSEDEIPFVPTGKMYVKFQPDVSDERCGEILSAHGLTINQVENGGFLVSITKRSENPLKTAAALQKLTEIETAEPSLATPGALQADSLWSDQWHLRNIGFHQGTRVGLRRGADARVYDAWRTLGNFGNPNIVVGVIDDGFDLTHPDLRNIVSPWDFTTGSSTITAGNHGTCCAGVAVGSSGGGEIIGAAPLSRLMPVRWGPYIDDQQIISWFGHVYDNKADVVSCSWGVKARNFTLSTLMSNAIKKVATQGRNGKGSVVLFAAGNDDRDINDPQSRSVNGFAIHPDVMAIAASTSMDVRSDYSNYGKEISVTAPSNGAGGLGILTSDIRGKQYGYSSDPRYYRSDPSGDYIYDFGGTSSATPLTAGIAALVLGVNPSLTARGVRSVLERSARKIEGATGFTKYHGHGVVNADAAVKLALSERG